MANKTEFKKRPVAERMFAVEYKDSSHTEKDESDLKSPRYVITPLGLEVNRVFIVGTLMKREQGKDKNGNVFYKAVVLDGTGTYFLSANSFDKDGMNQISMIDVSESLKVVAVIGKVAVNKTEEGRVYRQVRIESITESNLETRNMWILETAKLTSERMKNVRNGDVAKVKKYYEKVDTTKYEESIMELLNTF